MRPYTVPEVTIHNGRKCECGRQPYMIHVHFDPRIDVIGSASIGFFVACPCGMYTVTSTAIADVASLWDGNEIYGDWKVMNHLLVPHDTIHASTEAEAIARYAAKVEAPLDRLSHFTAERIINKI